MAVTALCGTLCVVVTVTTAPYISQRLSGVTAVSAGLSFFTGENFLQSSSGEETETAALQRNALDDISIHDEAGLLTDPESTSNPEPETDADDEDNPDEIPEKPGNAGSIVRQTLSAGNSSSFIPIGNSYVKSTVTKMSRKEVQEQVEEDLPFALEDTDEPQVLIYHTHATESYQPYQVDWYDKSYNARSTDDTKNMIAVGDVLAEKLEAAGIAVIHDTAHYDASYNGAYERSRVMIEETLEKYPSIKVVLDIHRDAIGSDPITAPVTTINGKSTAQVMIISCAGTDTEDVPNYQDNLTFAGRLQNQLEEDYPSLARPLLFGNRFYNQDLSVGALLIEVGGHGNTLTEAKRAMGYTADSLITLLKGTYE